MVKAAFRFSEEYNVVFMIRMVTRVCHSKSILECGEREEIPVKEWKPDPMKYVALPAHSRIHRVEIVERTKKLAELSESTPFNYVIDNGAKVGVIASGIAFQHAREVFGDEANYLKLGFTNPLPAGKIKDFCEGLDTVYVIEEDDPYIENFCKAQGVCVHGKDTFPPYGEMTADVIRKSLGLPTLSNITLPEEKINRRPPSLCAGCPHRGLFFRLGKRKDIMIAGDIGCYTLAAGAPYKAMNSTVCMGASISTGHGAQTAFNLAGVKRKVVTVLGDSTFFHTGINSLINTVYNNSNTINIILDNRITGMTGHQQNPGTGYTVKGEPTNLISIEAIVRAIGIKYVKVVNPNDLAAVDEALDAFMDLDEPSVIITRYPCVLKKFSQEDREEFEGLYKTKNVVLADKCIGCKRCQTTGCPALIFDKAAKKVHISRMDCVGCDVCAQVCPVQAIVKEEK